MEFRRSALSELPFLFFCQLYIFSVNFFFQCSSISISDLKRRVPYENCFWPDSNALYERNPSIQPSPIHPSLLVAFTEMTLPLLKFGPEPQKKNKKNNFKKIFSLDILVCWFVYIRNFITVVIPLSPLNFARSPHHDIVISPSVFILFVPACVLKRQ